MKIPFSWLKEYIAIDKTPEVLGNDLSMFAHELEEINKVGDDTVLDFEITPNRGDCLSIIGIARQISAMYNVRINFKKYRVNDEEVNKTVKIINYDHNLCQRFSARIIDHIKIDDSPKWLQEKLIAYGFRPINNIVDITNYVMVATGQPLHAFDYDKIKDGLLKIRGSKVDEEVITLDGKVRLLPDNAIIIEDEEKIYDLAGIMGGLKSEVDEKTKTIILQGAIFDAISIRKTSKILNHITDASYRYERGVDYEGTIEAVNMAASLIKENIPSAKIGKIIDEKYISLKIPQIKYQTENINRLLGLNLSKQDIIDYLSRLNIIADGNIASPPSYRNTDITIWQDIAEEVSRIYGFNNIQRNNLDKEKTVPNEDYNLREYLKDYLIEFGFTEIYSYSFADKEKLQLLQYKLDESIEIINPISPETQYLRPSLLPSLLSAIAKNPWSPEVNVFEIEKIFTSEGEKWQLGIATVDKDEILISERLKFFKLNTKVINVEQNILDIYKIRRGVKYVLIDLDEIKIKTSPIIQTISDKKYRKISKYPPTIRDLAFIVNKDLTVKEVETYIAGLDEKILFAENFDDFILKNGTRNVAFHIWLQNIDGPVKDEDANSTINNIIEKVKSKFNAELRS